MMVPGAIDIDGAVLLMSVGPAGVLGLWLFML